MKLKTKISKSFNKHADNYEKNAKVQYEIGLRLFERLDYLKITPRYILDLGCGPGIFTSLLKKKYPKTQIIALDLAFNMLLQAQKKQTWRRKWPLINADMTDLPFPNGLFDLVFANQTIHWSPPLALVMRELNRVMNSQACLMFSTLGPDTFMELKQAWAQVDHYAHHNLFADMHDVGDCLQGERFLDPVVDMELLTIHYNSVEQLLQSLKLQGMCNINPDRNKGLTSKGASLAFAQAYDSFCTNTGKYPLTYEVVYGHAWKGEQRRGEQGIETYIPISQIGRQ